jgi:protein ImuB
MSFDPSLLLLEVGASERLFGGLPRLLDRVRREVDQLGHRVQCAVAPTPTAAGLLARQRPERVIRERAGLATAVGDISLAQLTRDTETRELMRHLGLDSIRDALHLPRPELARRTTPSLPRLLDRLLGEAPDPRVEWQPPRRFVQRLELLGEIVQSTALAFPARRLMVGLCGFLRGCGGGAQRLCWQLRHRDLPDTCFELGLLDPSRDPDHMLEVFRERIERLTLDAPVLAIELQVDDWLPLEERSQGLFGDRQTLDHGLLERLGNRLGEQRVHSLRCRADHRPEHAWQLCMPGDSGTQTHSSPHHRVQPPWLLARPRPLDHRAGRPLYGGVLCLEQPPQRIEAGWWDGNDVTRDYFVAHSPAGERLWVFRDRRGGGWYLHGLFM